MRKKKQVEAELPVFQTVNKDYCQELDCRTYQLANKSSKYHETVLSYTAKLVKNVKPQEKAYFYDTKDPIFVSDFTATFKLEYDTNRIDKGKAMLVLSRYVNETLAIVLNSRMCMNDESTLITATIHNNDGR